MTILPVESIDWRELQKLFATAPEIWATGVGQGWYWFWKNQLNREHWVKVLDELGVIVGSAHWLLRLDGIRNLKELVVAPSVRGQGVGRLLVSHIGSPIVLKTDHDSKANGFYQHLGFIPGVLIQSKSGKKLLRCYSLAK